METFGPFIRHVTVTSIVAAVGWLAPADGTAAAQEVGSAEDAGDSKLEQGRLDEALAAFERALRDCDDDACTTRLHERIADVERRINFEAWQDERRGTAARR
ncbi:MAG: hypothetical protein V3U93_07975 [Alphaproteobacteria bacterium]